MAVYHFTIHAYRSWDCDHPRGYTRKGGGYQPPDPELAEQYDRNAKQDRVAFSAEIQQEILVLSHSICQREGWRLEAVGFDPTHSHQIISWRRFAAWEEVDRRLKNLLALRLNRRHNTPGKRWFVRRHSAPRHVKSSAHLNRLLTRYLPDHPGLFWKRGMHLPTLDGAG